MPLPCHIPGFTGQDVQPVAVAFTVVFGVLLTIQFLAMLVHRVSTLLHIAAITEVWSRGRDREERVTEEEQLDLARQLQALKAPRPQHQLKREEVPGLLKVLQRYKQEAAAIDSAETSLAFESNWTRLVPAFRTANSSSNGNNTTFMRKARQSVPHLDPAALATLAKMGGLQRWNMLRAAVVSNPFKMFSTHGGSSSSSSNNAPAPSTSQQGEPPPEGLDAPPAPTASAPPVDTTSSRLTLHDERASPLLARAASPLKQRKGGHPSPERSHRSPPAPPRVSSPVSELPGQVLPSPVKVTVEDETRSRSRETKEVGEEKMGAKEEKGGKENEKEGKDKEEKAREENAEKEEKVEEEKGEKEEEEKGGKEAEGGIDKEEKGGTQKADKKEKGAGKKSIGPKSTTPTKTPGKQAASTQSKSTGTKSLTPVQT